MSKQSDGGRRRRLNVDDEDFDENDKFTWVTKSLDSRELAVQLTFSDPLSVSSDAQDPATLHFEVKNKYFFMTKDDFKPLDDKIKIKPRVVPKQFPSKEEAEAQKKAA